MSGGLSGKFEIEESLEVMLGVIKLVNDSLHQPNIKGLPDQLFPLGSLLYQETFLVLTIKTQTQATVLSHQSQQSQQLLTLFFLASSLRCKTDVDFISLDFLSYLQTKTPSVDL